MANVIERIPRNIRAIFWIKSSDNNFFLSKNIKNVGQQISRKLKVVLVSESFHKFKDNKLVLIKISPKFCLIINTYPKLQLVCVEIFSVSKISPEKLNKTISEVFTKSIWIRIQYL